jgi:hypothetical protein
MNQLLTDYPDGLPKAGDLTPGGNTIERVITTGTYVLVTDSEWRTAIYLQDNGRRLETRKQLKDWAGTPTDWDAISDTRKDRLPNGVTDKESWNAHLQEVIGGY